MLIIVAKLLILDVCRGPRYASVMPILHFFVLRAFHTF